MTDGTLDPERRQVIKNKATGKEIVWTEELSEDLEGHKRNWEDYQSELVNHPKHYLDRKMEAIDIIEMIIEVEKNPKVAYNLSNAIKYLLRFRSKNEPIQDLEKAIWYLNRMIKHVKNEEK